MQWFRQYSSIFGSFILALIFMILPIPHEWKYLRPEWPMLVLIYWIFMLPQWVGVLIAWIFGLMMDVLKGDILGQYALSMAIVAYLAHLLRSRSRLFPFWQQLLVVLVLVGLGKLSLLLVLWLKGTPPQTLWYWSSTLTSVLLWPGIYRLMRMYENRTFYSS